MNRTEATNLGQRIPTEVPDLVCDGILPDKSGRRLTGSYIVLVWDTYTRQHRTFDSAEEWERVRVQYLTPEDVQGQIQAYLANPAIRDWLRVTLEGSTDAA